MRKTRPPVGSLVEVDWIDAHSTDSSWLNEHGPEFNKSLKPTECQTVGWVIKASKMSIVVAASRSVQIADNSWDYGSVWNIPMGMVQKVIVLKTLFGVAPADKVETS